MSAIETVRAPTDGCTLRTSMERGDFTPLATAALEHIEEVLGDLERDDFDVDLGGDVLTLSYQDGSQFIINAHSAAGQIWLAAGSRAWHFDYEAEGKRWVSQRNGDELMSTVAREVSSKLGAEVSL